jgi:hypothetical protein
MTLNQMDKLNQELREMVLENERILGTVLK